MLIISICKFIINLNLYILSDIFGEIFIEYEELFGGREDKKKRYNS